MVMNGTEDYDAMTRMLNFDSMIVHDFSDDPHTALTMIDDHDNVDLIDEWGVNMMTA